MDESGEIIYRELDQTSHCTRLLRLYPALDPASSVECELLVVVLTPDGAVSTERLKYKALSYAWKEDDNEVQITNTVLVRAEKHWDTYETMWVKVEVPRSLFLALQRLRPAEGEKLLWVDSLCINQRDETERTQQVAMMSEIYSLADSVVIWLGDRAVDDEMGEWLQGPLQRTVVFTDWSDGEQCEALVTKYQAGYRKLKTSSTGPLRRRSDIFGAFCLIWVLAQGRQPADIEFYHSFLTEPRQSGQLHIYERGSKTQRFTYEWTAQVSQGLRAIMNRNWWRRAWVVQETVLARDATVIYGTLSAPWTMFAKAALSLLKQRSTQDSNRMELYRSFHMLRDDPRTEDALDSFSRTVLSIEATRMQWTLRQRITLLDLLRRFRLRSSSDDRDKVYSFLALVNSKRDYPVTVNYSSPTVRVYRDSTIQIIRSTRSLSVLAGTLRSVYRVHLHGFPSWVTDWGAPTLEFETERLNRLDLYDAAKDVPAHVILHYPSALEIRGYIIALVYHEFDTAPDTAARMRATIERWMYQWRQDGRFGSQPDSAFWRTLCGDTLYTPTEVLDPVGLPQATYHRAKENIKEAFQAWGDDRKTQFNRKTSMIGGLTINSYEEPDWVVERKNAYHYSTQSSSVFRKIFAYKKPESADLDALLKSENREMLLADRKRPCGMGIGPQDLRAGDYVCVAFGSKVPFIIRRSEQHCCAGTTPTVLVSGDNSPREQSPCSSRHDTFHLIGDAYVHGIMDGEAISAGLVSTPIILM